MYTFLLSKHLHVHLLIVFSLSRFERLPNTYKYIFLLSSAWEHLRDFTKICIEKILIEKRISYFCNLFLTWQSMGNNFPLPLKISLLLTYVVLNFFFVAKRFFSNRYQKNCHVLWLYMSCVQYVMNIQILMSTQIYYSKYIKKKYTENNTNKLTIK